MIYLTRRILAIAALFLLPASLAAQGVNPEQAKAKVDAVGKSVLAVISDKSRGVEQRREELERIFLREVDAEWMGRFVLGRQLRSATPEERARYAKVYPLFLAKSYTSKFSEYAGESFEIVGTSVAEGGDAVVQTRILRQGEPPLVVDYRLRQSENGQVRVNDIIVEGVSLLTTQRGEFGAVVSRQGMDYLVERLEAKIQAFDNGVAQP